MLKIKTRRTTKVFLDTLKLGDTFSYKRLTYMVCLVGGVLDTICLNDGEQYPLPNVKVEKLDYTLVRTRLG